MGLARFEICSLRKGRHLTLKTPRTRFAPSPTGYLHLGHARAAFEAFDFAQILGGECLLRIEDIDHTRCRPEYTSRIYRDLDALGLDWPLPVRVQSRHIDDYARVVADLLRRGLAYPCPLTRAEIDSGNLPAPPPNWPKGNVTAAEISTSPRPQFGNSPHPNPNSTSNTSVDSIRSDYSHNQTLDLLSGLGEMEKPQLPASIRLDISACLNAISDCPLTFHEIDGHGRELEAQREVDAISTLRVEFGLSAPNVPDSTATRRPDPIIARRDIGVSYHIAVTHDDAAQGITHVVRGADLRDQTPLHVLIQTLMSWPVPHYYHHALVLRADGEKLAKRNLDTALHNLLEAHQTPADIRALCGLQPQS